MKSNKLRKNFWKAKEGISSILSAIVVLSVFILLMMIYLYLIGCISHNTDVNAVGRKYLMKMETNGYLTAEDQRQLIEDLKAIPNVESVTIYSDTSTSFVGHHNDLILHFSCMIKDMPIQSIPDLFSPEVDQDALREVEVQLSSAYI